MRRSVTALGLTAAAAILLVLMASVASAGGKPKPQPPTPDPNPAIAIVYEDWLTVMDADGSNVTPIAEIPDSYGAHGPVQPEWSPDGLQILITGCRLPIYRVNLDGSGFTELDADPGNSYGAWSPGSVLNQGQKIAFLRDMGYVPPYDFGTMDLFLMDPDGTHVVNLTDSPYVHDGDCQIAWSPESDRIATVRDGHLVVYQLGLVGEEGDIQIVNTFDVTEASGDARLSYLPGTGTYVDWSNAPGSNLLALRTSDYEISVVDLNYPYGVTAVTAAGDGLAGKHGVSWSPDDTKLAVSVVNSPGLRPKKGAGLWTIDLLTGERVQLLSGYDLRRNSWWANATD